jgi:glycosyltransferase involved in cell wall biosynthesis
MMNPLKVCIFTETYYPVVGGGETQARILAEGLIANGHTVLLVTRRSDRSLKKIEKYGALTVYRLSPAGNGQLKKWGLLFSSFPVLIRLQKQYDVIFVSGFRIIGITAVFVSKLFQKSCILKADSQGEMSGDFFNNGLGKFRISREWLPFKLFLKVRNEVLKKADAFAAISSETANDYSGSGVNASSIYIIPNSVDTARFFPVTTEEKARLRSKLDIPQTAISVVYTGRLVSYKGLPLLLRVWREICQAHKHLKLILVGTGGLDMHNCEAELRDYVKANALEPYVQFTGSVENVQEYLQASDIFAFPSENDAFPSSLIEAMACAMAVITTPVGSIKTFVSDGVNGILVQPGDFQQLYQAIDRLITDQDFAFRLGQAGLETVQAHYSAEVVTKSYLSLFERTAALHTGNQANQKNFKERI